MVSFIIIYFKVLYSFNEAVKIFPIFIGGRSKSVFARLAYLSPWMHRQPANIVCDQPRRNIA